MKPDFLVRMLLLGFVLVAAQSVNAAQQNGFPPADAGYVTDAANLLTASEEEQIEQELFRVEKGTGIEVAVVTVFSIHDYPSTPVDSMESFARGLFDHYRVGNMPDNKGILLLVARNDRKARIELGAGYGLGRDVEAARIIENIVLPSFRNDQYGKGIVNGTQAICHEFAGSGLPVRSTVQWLWYLAALIVIGLIVWSLIRNGTRGWGWVFVGLILIVGLVFVRFLMTAVRRRYPDSGSSGGWSAGGFGGGFGGGFSGGGGATGSW